MLSTSIVALSSLFIGAQAVALDARSASTCFTTHTGYLQSNGADFGLNSANEVIFPSTGTNLELSLQACEEVTSYGSFDYPTSYYGRLVSTKTTSQCLTVTPSASNASILNAELAACGSDAVPPANQIFYYEDNDFGNQLLFAGQTGCTELSGTIIDDAGNPVTASGTTEWQLQCISADGGASTFGLSGTWDN